MKARISFATLAVVLPLCGCSVENAVDTPDTGAKAETARASMVETTSADELATPWPRDRQPGSLTELQRKTYTGFENTMGFGAGRMIPPPGHQLPSQYVSAGGLLDFTNAYPPDSQLHGRWKVENLQLIGTLHDPAGVAYDTKKNEWHRITAATLAARLADQNKQPSAHALPVRPLNEFEKETLATIRDGGNLLFRADGDRVHMVGAIRAMNASCMNCHEVEKGRLMGAFTYDLRRLSKDEAEQEAAATAQVLP